MSKLLLALLLLLAAGSASALSRAAGQEQTALESSSDDPVSDLDRLEARVDRIVMDDRAASLKAEEKRLRDQLGAHGEECKHSLHKLRSDLADTRARIGKLRVWLNSSMATLKEERAALLPKNATLTKMTADVQAQSEEVADMQQLLDSKEALLADRRKAREQADRVIERLGKLNSVDAVDEMLSGGALHGCGDCRDKVLDLFHALNAGNKKLVEELKAALIASLETLTPKPDEGKREMEHFGAIRDQLAARLAEMEQARKKQAAIVGEESASVKALHTAIGKAMDRLGNLQNMEEATHGLLETEAARCDSRSKELTRRMHLNAARLSDANVAQLAAAVKTISADAPPEASARSGVWTPGPPSKAPTMGAPCEIDIDCTGVGVCFAGQCSPVCNSAADPRDAERNCVWNEANIPTGKQCSKSEHCASGACEDGLCKAVLSEACTFDAGCAASLLCVTGSCVQRCRSEADPRDVAGRCLWNHNNIPNGQACVRSRHCASGLCDMHVCRSFTPVEAEAAAAAAGEAAGEAIAVQTLDDKEVAAAVADVEDSLDEGNAGASPAEAEAAADIAAAVSAGEAQAEQQEAAAGDAAVEELEAAVDDAAQGKAQLDDTLAELAGGRLSETDSLALNILAGRLDVDTAAARAEAADSGDDDDDDDGDDGDDSSDSDVVEDGVIGEGDASARLRATPLDTHAAEDLIARLDAREAAGDGSDDDGDDVDDDGDDSDASSPLGLDLTDTHVFSVDLASREDGRIGQDAGSGALRALLPSCRAIKLAAAAPQDVPSGVYLIQTRKSGTLLKVYCDMQTLGGGWTRVFVQDDRAGLFEPGQVAASKHQPNAAVYSILDELDNFRGAESRFEFMMRWPNSPVYTNYQQWTQSSNPVRSLPGVPAADYAAIHTPYTMNGWSGLARNKQADFSLLDGSWHTDDYFFAVGLCQPVPPGGTHEVELWVREWAPSPSWLIKYFLSA
eukprot:PLAT11820.1.p2 GENE.PLAT11820.1~~PLAT11820.1.p2  ORF type:complete len:967 (-),score=560.76 PLAT11820.1:81-2981(-)